MGFNNQNEQNDTFNGIRYTEGKPSTVKFNAKEGIFQELGNDFGEKSITIHLLKRVTLPELILFPFDENATPVENTILYFIDCETNNLSTGLVKTFSEGSLEKLIGQINKYAKDDNEGLDYTDFEITATWKKLPKETKGYYYIDFTFCKDAKGKPCHMFVVDEDSSQVVINDKAIPQKLDEATFERNREFFVEHCQNGDNIYDYRLAKEIVARNYDVSNVDYKQLPLYRLYVLYNLGFFSDTKLGQLNEALSPKVPKQFQKQLKAA